MYATIPPGLSAKRVVALCWGRFCSVKNVTAVRLEMIVRQTPQGLDRRGCISDVLDQQMGRICSLFAGF